MVIYIAPRHVQGSQPVYRLGKPYYYVPDISLFFRLIGKQGSARDKMGYAISPPAATLQMYRAFYYIVLSSVYEKASGIRAVTRVEFLNEIDAIINRLFHNSMK